MGAAHFLSISGAKSCGPTLYVECANEEYRKSPVRIRSGGGSRFDAMRATDEREMYWRLRWSLREITPSIAQFVDLNRREVTKEEERCLARRGSIRRDMKARSGYVDPGRSTDRSRHVRGNKRRIGRVGPIPLSAEMFGLISSLILGQ